MNRDNIIEFIDTLTEPFSASDVIKYFSGSNLTIVDKNIILETIIDLVADGKLFTREMNGKYLYVTSKSLTKILK